MIYKLLQGTEHQIYSHHLISRKGKWKHIGLDELASEEIKVHKKANNRLMYAIQEV